MRILYETLFLSDIHMPSHNVSMVGPEGKIFKLIKKKKYKKIVQNGDLVCFDDFSAHKPIPGKDADAVESIKLVKEFNANLRKAAGKDAEIWYVEGNHEQRLENYLVRNAPHLLPLDCLSLPKLFELEKHGIKWKSVREKLNIDGLKVTHGTIVRPESGSSARGEMKKALYKQSGVSGHCHRAAWIKDYGNTWMELGNLADPDTDKQMYLKDSSPNWVQAFGTGTCCEDNQGNKHWFLKLIEIKDNYFVVDGVIY